MTDFNIKILTDWKDKRFSFFADPQKKEKESHHTFGTLPFARHKPTLRKSQRAKSC